MPELPEVETVKRGFSKLVGSVIQSVVLLNKNSFQGRVEDVIGLQVLAVGRRGKVLILYLSNQKILLLHLKMSGQLILEKHASGKERVVGGHPTKDMYGVLPNKSTRIIVELKDPGSKNLVTRFYFNDQRKFGWVKVVSSTESIVHSLFEKLGPEPLEKGFNWMLLKNNLLKHKNMPVKTAIMDQTVVAGIGNIYASEACFNAGIDPRLKVIQLNDVQFEKLYYGIIKALQDGIKYGGSSKVHFVNPEGKKGYFLDYACVYWKDGEPCKTCGSIIQKLQLSGRGTYFCPSCQA